MPTTLRYRVKHTHSEPILTKPILSLPNDPAQDEIDELRSFDANRDDQPRMTSVHNVSKQVTGRVKAAFPSLSNVQTTLVYLRNHPDFSEESIFSHYPTLIALNIYALFVIALPPGSFVHEPISSPSHYLWEITLSVIAFISVVLLELVIFRFLIRAAACLMDDVIQLTVDLDDERPNTID